MGQRGIFVLAFFVAAVTAVFHGSQGYAKSPSPTTSVLSPVGSRTPSFGFHGKLPRSNTPSPTISPKEMPPKVRSLPPSIQGPVASIPANSSSQHKIEEHKFPKEITPTTGSHAPHSPIGEGTSPSIPPVLHKRLKLPDNASPVPISFRKPPTMEGAHRPAPASLPSPSIFIRKHHGSKRASIPASAPPPANPFPPSYHQGPVSTTSPSRPPVALSKRNRQRHHSPPPLIQGPSLPPIPPPIPLKVKQRMPASSPSVTIPSRPTYRAPSPLLTAPHVPTKGAPSPSLMVPSSPNQGPLPARTISPLRSFPGKPKMPVASPVRPLPPPHPNQDCSSVTCVEPFTNTPPGSPCDCVWPMQVRLRLSVALYTFFPLVSELAQEIATGVFMKQSQVRIMGANAASQEPDKTIVLIDLVPLGAKFDNTTAFLTYAKFWHKQVYIKSSFFGDYEVLYVRYPGLPPSPPSAPLGITADEGQLANDNNSGTRKPLGVDVRKRKERLGSSLIAIVVLSSATALAVCVGAIWLLLWKRGIHMQQTPSTPQASVPLAKASVGAGSMTLGSWPSSVASASLSFSSSIAAYTGSAKTFSIGEIEKATDNFDASTILGEGGFGRVYRGILEDGTSVAVKVLKRDDQQGTREFLAEVEMLSRLHHRNLVKLIGICTEEHSRCLVYELIPNGSVESHLHGVDKETSPLDWGARMKIALGSARGLAYLHEDSSPRVIHRDFKSSNILLEYDFTPKVSDFGLARAALDGGNEQISTRVMGTFGYVAPEYAMTGHLLVKSDVYSYGVVLLELLSGRKPVDMSRPLGQENLVAWARSLLTSKEGLEVLIDPALGSNFPFDSVAKVAAIASMCVQPEVSHRPFMGEVVQALKLVCNESDEKKGESERYSRGNSSIQDADIRVRNASGLLPEDRSFLTADYDLGHDTERALSTLDVFDASGIFTRQESGSFRRHSSSGPLRMERNVQFGQRGVPRGSVSEHGVALKLWQVLDVRERWS